MALWRAARLLATAPARSSAAVDARSTRQWRHRPTNSSSVLIASSGPGNCAEAAVVSEHWIS